MRSDFKAFTSKQTAGCRDWDLGFVLIVAHSLTLG